MTLLHALGVAGVAVLAACSTAAYEVDAGYARMAVDGTVALATGTSGIGNAVDQDIDSGFGLGDERGSTFLRFGASFGGPSLCASGFFVHDRGSGVLAATFGGLAQATPVSSDLELGNAKLGAAWTFDVGPVSIAPGVALDVFDLDFRASDQAGNAEILDELVAVPLAMLRAKAALGAFWASGEVGYIEASTGGSGRSTFLDAEATLGWSPSPATRVFVGYRFIDVDATGDTGTESFGLDLRIEGWFLGGGVDL